MTSMPTRILIADDHDLLRDTLKSYLESQPQGFSVLSARNLNDALVIAEAEPDLDVVLLDVDMNGMNGLDGLVATLGCKPKVPVALLSGLTDPAIMTEAFQKGAAGFIPKSLGARAMLSALQVILAGDRYAPASMLDQMNAVLSPPAQDAGKPEKQALTSDESIILEMLRGGSSNKEIARKLGVEEYTVKYYMRGLFKKLGAKNRTHAAMIANERSNGAALEEAL